MSLPVTVRVESLVEVPMPVEELSFTTNLAEPPEFSVYILKPVPVPPPVAEILAEGVVVEMPSLEFVVSVVR